MRTWGSRDLELYLRQGDAFRPPASGTAEGTGRDGWGAPAWGLRGPWQRGSESPKDFLAQGGRERGCHLDVLPHSPSQAGALCRAREVPLSRVTPASWKRLCAQHRKGHRKRRGPGPGGASAAACCGLGPRPPAPPITPAGTWQRPSHKVTKHSVRGWRPGSPTSFLRCPLARPTPSGSNSQSLVHPRPAEAEGPHPPPKSPPQAEGGRLPGGRGPGAQPGGGEGGQRGAGGGR